ncbi:uncharacterized protein METZ01_LOCUS333964, partial [marine metagenome]
MSLGPRLEGKVAIVTGGASGIGEATVKIFVEHGAKAVIADVDEKKGRLLEGLLNSSSESTMFYRLDVSKESEWIRCVDEAVKKWGRLDIIVNNAGM